VAFPASKYWLTTLFFRNSDGSGFSESYYNLQADVPDPTTPLDTMVTNRRNILNSNTHLFGARLSDPGKFRDIILPPIGTSFGVGQVDGMPMAFESAFLFRVAFDDNNVRPRTLHGFTNGDMDEASEFVVAGPTTSASVNTYWNHIKTTFKLILFNQQATTRYPTPFTDHAMVGFQYAHFRQHDIGRPFGLRRGRASPTA
jgi:hypothetical protein